MDQDQGAGENQEACHPEPEAGRDRARLLHYLSILQPSDWRKDEHKCSGVGRVRGAQGRSNANQTGLTSLLWLISMTIEKWFIRLAGFLLLIHGGIEVLGLLGFLGFPPTFAFAEISANWPVAIWIGVVSGVLRVLAAAGLFGNRRWGWMLGLLLCVITMASLTFYLPFGLMDSVLSGAVLALLVIARYENEKIIE